jgi:Domain of unknown function (DUF4365)
MTQRPRSHQLEEQSRRAFVASLPTEWVYRDILPDYGIDGLVEVFDSAGDATGQQFFVQIKATDIESVEQSLRVRLTTRHLEYYRSLVLPVLLARYHAVSDQIFAVWVSDGLHISSKMQSSIVNLSISNLWTRERLPSVVDELSALQSLIARGSRERRIEQYYKNKSLSIPADPATGPPTKYKRFAPGEKVFHAVFGIGTVESESEYYVFLKFDDDKLERKFLPGSSNEFVRI